MHRKPYSPELARQQLAPPHGMLDELNLQSDRVHFLGRIPYGAYRSLLQVSAAHVYLTYPFVLSWSMLEAMACGCALVASDTAPVREVIRHGENGWLVDFFDAHALASRIAAVLEAPAASHALRLRAAATVRARYGLEDGVRQYRALLGLDRAPARLTSLQSSGESHGTC